MFEFFAFGGILFWALVAIAIIPLFVAVERDNSFLAVVWLLGAVIVFQLFTDTKPLSWIAAHPWTFVIYIAAYLGAGVVWGVIKWMSFVYQIRDKYAAFRTEWFSRAKIDPNTASAQDKSQMQRDARMELRVQSLPPKISDSKGSLMLWMVYWPISMVWTVLNDPVRRFYNWVYARMAGGLQRISDAAFAKFGIDFER